MAALMVCAFLWRASGEDGGPFCSEHGFGGAAAQYFGGSRAHDPN